MDWPKAPDSKNLRGKCVYRHPIRAVAPWKTMILGNNGRLNRGLVARYD